MQSAVDLTVREIASIRTGRATSGLVEDIQVLVYGGQQRLSIKELASITVPDPSIIVIEPWDKSIVGEVRKGLMEANVGFNPILSEQLLRISIPPMTGEDREKYVKLLSTFLEKGRVMVRQVRGDEMHNIKKQYEEKTITEDEKFRFEGKLQGLTDEHIDKIEAAGEAKKQELLSL